MTTALRTSLLAAYLTGQPWGMYRPVLEALNLVVWRHEHGEKVSEAEIRAIVAERDARAQAPGSMRAEYDGLGAVEPDPDARQKYRVAGKVGVVPIQGVLSKYAGSINGMSQPTGMSFDDVGHAVVGALTDARTSQGVVMAIDSPGGTVAGGADCLGRIRQAIGPGGPAQGKRLVAMAQDCTCSMAYLLASACDRVYCTGNAVVGSIGVLNVVDDTSAALKEAGITRRVVANHPIKAMLAKGTPVTPEAIDELQRSVDAAAMWFMREALVNGRGMSEDKAAELATGRVWTGQDAVAIGLCDGVTTLGELVTAMNATP